MPDSVYFYVTGTPRVKPRGVTLLKEGGPKSPPLEIPSELGTDRAA